MLRSSKLIVSATLIVALSIPATAFAFIKIDAPFENLSPYRKGPAKIAGGVCSTAGWIVGGVTGAGVGLAAGVPMGVVNLFRGGPKHAFVTPPFYTLGGAYGGGVVTAKSLGTVCGAPLSLL